MIIENWKLKVENFGREDRFVFPKRFAPDWINMVLTFGDREGRHYNVTFRFYCSGKEIPLSGEMGIAQKGCRPATDALALNISDSNHFVMRVQVNKSLCII